MITEVRVIGTGEILFRDEVPNGMAIHVHDDTKVKWVKVNQDGEHWITLSASAKVTLCGSMLNIEELPPEPEPVPATSPLRIDVRKFGGVGAPYYSQRLPVEGGIIYNYGKIEHIRFRPEDNSLLVTTAEEENCTFDGKAIDIGV